ncbi:glycoside hydrolase [Curtobacterium sp. MCBA15_016]|uniref:family 43 glycosylhydrolase n=1 Tax=Curtobacterium sp. MCBA15_016 TaxID=1898740 RepID=UPI0008DD21F6|nr:family 43 glycosylhydrolase [Curtobacterium sp. MCBA15_016]OII18166.1 glycoside hydrolase [Curtobacterium sp. MCBA15_016]
MPTSAPDPAAPSQTVRLVGAPWGDTSRRGRPYAKDPSVIRFGGRYLLYCSLPSASDDEPEGWSVGIAESDDLVTWRTVAVLPSFGEYDRSGAAAPGAVVIDGRVHLFFQTYGRGREDSICHAVSDDGLTFTPNPENPVFRPTGEWTCGRAIDADLVVAGDWLLLGWVTRDPTMTTQLFGTARAPLGSAYGHDDWEQLSVDGPALAPELPWEQDCIEAPALRWDGETFTVFYAGAYNNQPQQIGWATSPDGRTWTRGSDEPLVPAGPDGAWNHSESGHPGFFRDEDGREYLFFQGNPDDGHTWCIAATELTFVDGVPVVQTDPVG